MTFMAPSRLVAAARRRDRHAEHMSNGGSLRQFAKIDGVSEMAARKAWKKITDDLGWQAQ